jgi:hypothetical protein
MVTIESNIEIARVVPEVFKYCLDVKAWPKWMGEEVEAEQTSEGQLGIGATFKGSIKGLGPTGAWVGKMMEYEPNRKCAYIIDAKSCHIEASVYFASQESRTLVQLAYRFQGYGFLRLLAPFMKGAMRKRTDESLGVLKGILES